jgi:hypothetical protein
LDALQELKRKRWKETIGGDFDEDKLVMTKSGGM